jgi:hypothetical protein
MAHTLPATVAELMHRQANSSLMFPLPGLVEDIGAMPECQELRQDRPGHQRCDSTLMYSRLAAAEMKSNSDGQLLV